MQFFWKNILLILLSIIVSACSSEKSINEDLKCKNITSSKILRAKESKNTLTSNENLLHFQLQQLKQNSVIYFDLDKYNIHSNFKEMLDTHANFLRRRKPFYKITIEGYTDERGTPEYNISLGERRASAVKAYLQGKGVSAEQIYVVSYGKEKPVSFGHKETDYAKNRRAVLVYPDSE